MDCFLSYSRADDDGVRAGSFVARLHRDLTRAGLLVWWDRTDMPNRGPTFDEEIRETISRVDRLLLVVGPGATQSSYVRDEWEWALKICKPVVPILRFGDHSSLPPALLRVDATDFRGDGDYPARLEYLIRQLQEPVADPGKLVNVPDLPPFYVARKEELDRVKTYLVRDPNRNLSTGIQRRCLIHGMAGIGKSVLAAAVARECDVRWGFPDGIVRITLGKEPDIALSLSNLLQALGESLIAEDEQGLRARISEVLSTRSCLIILDDVWKSAHVTAFEVMGPRCAMLITGRDSTITAGLGIRDVRLGRLSNEQAFELLANWSERDDAALPLILDRLGNLPLALKIAGARLRRGMSGTEWLEKFRNVSQIKIGRRAEGRDENLQICFDLSVRELAPRERDLYFVLGIFAKGSSIPQSATTRLWHRLDPSLDDFFCSELREDLVQMALIDRPEDSRLLLHDLLHDYCYEQIAHEAQQLHQTLLAAYNPEEKPWPDLEDDGYLFSHLSTHLLEAGREQHFHELLWQETSDSKNAWYLARDCLGQGAGFRADISQAWRLVKDHSSDQQQHETFIKDLALQVRYALITASLNSRSTDIPTALMASSVSKQVWTPHQALARAEGIENPDKRLQALLELEPELPSNLKLEAAQEMFKAGKELGPSTMIELAPRLPEPLREEILKIAIATIAKVRFRRKSSGNQASFFQALARNLKTSLLPMALEAADQISDVEDRALSVIELLPLLSEPQRTARLAELISSISQLPNAAAKTRVIGGLAPHLPTELLPKVFELARTIEVPARRAETFSLLAACVPDDKRLAVFAEALHFAESVRPSGAKAKVIRDMAISLAELGYADRALQTAQAIGFPAGYADALNVLIPKLPEDQRLLAQKELLRIVEQIGRPDKEAQVLIELTPGLSESLLTEALAAANKIGTTWKREVLLCDLAARFSEPKRSEILQGAIETARLRGKGVTGDLSTHLAKLGLFEKALEVARSIADDETRAGTFRRVLALLPERERDHAQAEALEAAQQIKIRRNRALALMRLASDLKEEAAEKVFKEAESVALDIPGDDDTWAWINRVHHDFRKQEKVPATDLTHEEFQKRIEEAQKIGDAGQQWDCELAFAPYIAEQMLPEILAKLQKDEVVLPFGSRGKALATLAPRLSETMLTTTIDGMLNSGSDAIFVIHDLAELTVFLPEPTLRWLLDMVLELRIGQAGINLKFGMFLDPNNKDVKEFRQETFVECLKKLGSRIAEVGYSEKALKAIRKFVKPLRTEGLLAIAPHLDEPFRQIAIEEIIASSQMDNPKTELGLLLCLAPYFSEDLRAKYFSRVLKYSRKDHRFIGLLALVPHLSGDAQKIAIEAARKFTRERFAILGGIARGLHESERTELIQTELSSVRSDEQRKRYLRAFVEYLPQSLQWETLNNLLAKKRLTTEDLLVLTKQLSGEPRQAGLRKATSLLIGEKIDSLLEGLRRLVPFVKEIPNNDLLVLWNHTIQQATPAGRPMLLRALSVLAPYSFTLGGEILATESLLAIKKVARWWP